MTAMNRRFPADVYTAVHGRDLRRVAAAFEPEACGRWRVTTTAPPGWRRASIGC